ncbi:MAG: tRNA dihydrouridine synthase DusB [Propionibacteriaceae bacterium]
MELLKLSAPSQAAAVGTLPIVLAPMAGITNAAYRQLCREQAELVTGNQQAGLYVCEMITSRALVERNSKTIDMLTFDPGEKVRSVQLYGVDPETMGKATSILCQEFGVSHVDLNFGCPVPKVTRKGGGGVLPWKKDRFQAIIRATVRAADQYGIPVTVKTRKGIDDDHLTYLDAGRIAQAEGAAAITLHGRTVAEHYAGKADWESIARLVAALDIPVLGNGDIWEAPDALRMLEQTGAAGVVVGRGCLGRPWLFRDLADAVQGRQTQALPTLGEVIAMAKRHGELLITYQGGKYGGIRDLRKHMAWYFKGFPLGGELRHSLGMIESLEQIDEILAGVDQSMPYPKKELGSPRGRQGQMHRKVAMPDGWLLDQSGLADDLSDAEDDVSGG